MWGCSGDPPPPKGNGGLPYEGQTVRLLIVDDPALAKAVRELRKEWKARSGAELAIEETTSAEFVQTNKLDADAVIYPSQWLGTVAEKERMGTPPDELFTTENQRFNWPDVFPAIRRREATWGAKTVALPLGSRVLVCYYRTDLLKRHAKQPPKTWEEYQELVRFFTKRPKEIEIPTVEPLGKGWAGITLLARAAAYAKHEHYFSALFDLQTMEPRIDYPPYVRALEELMKANVSAEDGGMQSTPTDAVDRFVSGQCALAIGWPHGRAQDGGPVKIDTSAAGCVALPGSDESYNWSRGRYDRMESNTATLLACSGRFASVPSRTKQRQAAWQLLSSLADTDWGTRVSSASPATAPFRASQIPAAKRWLIKSHSSVLAGYGRAVATALSTTEVVYVPRIPGGPRYLAALDDAVRQAVTGRLTARAALRQAADRWREITKELGKDAQRRACENSVVRLGS